MAGIQQGLIGSLYGAVGDYESIATVTVGAGGSDTITFSSIPSTYKHLQIRLMVSSWETAGQIMHLRLNSDTGNNYARHYLTGDGSSPTANAVTSIDSIRIFGTAVGGSTSYPAISITDILDYTDTNKYTTVRALNGGDYNGSGAASLHSGVWMNTSAVTSIVITSSYLDFNQYSHFALYGSK